MKHYLLISLLVLSAATASAADNGIAINGLTFNGVTENALTMNGRPAEGISSSTETTPTLPKALAELGGRALVSPAASLRLDATPRTE